MHRATFIGIVCCLLIGLLALKTDFTFPVMIPNNALNNPVQVVQYTDKGSGEGTLTLADGKTIAFYVGHSYLREILADTNHQIEVYRDPVTGDSELYANERIFYCGTGRARIFWFNLPLFPRYMLTYQRRCVGHVK